MCVIPLSKKSIDICVNNSLIFNHKAKKLHDATDHCYFINTQYVHKLFELGDQIRKSVEYSYW